MVNDCISNNPICPLTLKIVNSQWWTSKVSNENKNKNKDNKAFKEIRLHWIPKRNLFLTCRVSITGMNFYTTATKGIMGSWSHDKYLGLENQSHRLKWRSYFAQTPFEVSLSFPKIVID